MELNKIFNEECLDGMKKIPDDSVDLILCDLPYGTTSCSWDTIIPFDLLWEQYNRISKKNCPIVLFGAEPFSTMLRMSNLKCYKYDWYWEKNAPTGFVYAKNQPMRDIETVSVFCKGKALYKPQGVYRLPKPISSKKKMQEDAIYDSKGLSEKPYIQEYSGYPKNVIKIRNTKVNNFHPTQKPVELFEYLIKTYSEPGDIVVDNCMGSGTTAIAAINTDRNFIGFEMDEEYFNKAVKRIDQNTTQLDLFED